MRRILFVLFAVFACAGLWWLSSQNYLLFHSIIEIAAVVVAVNITIVALVTQSYSRNSFVFKLGMTYLAVAIIDFLHTMAFNGMGVFQTWGPNEPTQFWILGRAIEIGGLTGSLLSLGSAFTYILFPTIIATGSLAGTVLIFSGHFPDCFIVGLGLTPFKVYTEYIFIGVLSVLVILILSSRAPKETRAFRRGLVWSLVLTIMAEASFTLYTDVYGISNALGHMFRLASYAVIFYWIVLKSLKDPVSMLYQRIKDEARRFENMATLDPLTEAYTRHFLNEWMERKGKQPLQTDQPLVIVMLDVNDFKQINDRHGHLVGDRVLEIVASSLMSSVRRNDFVVRYGGDEFVVVLNSCTMTHAEEIISRVKSALLDNREELGFPISISYGAAFVSSYSEMQSALSEADKKMYEMKEEADSVKEHEE